MQETNIANIDYDNDENAKIIEDALKETEVLDIEQESIMPEQQQPIQQPFQNPQQYIPSNKPSPFQQEYQQTTLKGKPNPRIWELGASR